MVNAQEVVARALALSEAATDGPWAPIGDADDYLRRGDVTGPGEPGFRTIICEHAGPDAEFIAAARTLLPALAKALGDVLAVVDDQGDQGFSDTEAMVRVYRAVLAALSEVAP